MRLFPFFIFNWIIQKSEGRKKNKSKCQWGKIYLILFHQFNWQIMVGYFLFTDSIYNEKKNIAVFFQYEEYGN